MQQSVNLAQEVEALQQKLTGSLSGINSEMAGRKPDGNGWSVVDCLEHLFLVERGVLGLLQRTADPVPDAATEVAGRGKIDYLLGNRTRKVTAPEMFEPRGKFSSLQDATGALAGVRSQLAEMLQQNRIVLDGHKIPHPRLGDFTRLDWMHFLLAHGERHRHQIEEIKAGFLA